MSSIMFLFGVYLEIAFTVISSLGWTDQTDIFIPLPSLFVFFECLCHHHQATLSENKMFFPLTYFHSPPGHECFLTVGTITSVPIILNPLSCSLLTCVGTLKIIYQI